MPTEGPLVDRYGRVHDDLRISVTDRCNLRCVYCMPNEGMTFLPRAEVLTFEEILRVAGVARSLGVRSVRLTGGEPLVRRGICDLVGSVADLGFDDVALTTNGILLAPIADRLAAAGLRRVNVSCDSLRPERFASIRRRGELDVVLDAMASAESAGLVPLKVNVVLLRGRNDDEILDFAAFSRDTGRIVRFIEYMPLD
ncbi:MAG: GTP 3',8-cyclase MoaA, partial [Acidimicrobiales bacterium]